MKLMSSDGTWSDWYGWTGGIYEMQTTTGPAATVFNNNIVLVVKGRYGTPYANTISYMSSNGSAIGAWYPWVQIPGGTTSSRPQVAWGPTPNTFYVTAKGSATNTMWENYYDSIAQQWAGWVQSAGGSSTAPAIGTYWFNP